MVKKKVNVVNSREYWDNRFEKDWIINRGDSQSRNFGILAKELMPNWLIDIINKNKFSVCDWGCAEGDGSDVLSTIFPDSKITGIDFSAKAIESAKNKYSKINFTNADILKANKLNLQFDVIFSSNTFEHFKDPNLVFKKLSRYSRYFIIIMVPFEEDVKSLYPEHFSSFNWSFITSKQPDWSLNFINIVDIKDREKTPWQGKQLLLVYSKTVHNKDLSISIQDVADNIWPLVLLSITNNDELKLKIDFLEKNNRDLQKVTEKNVNTIDKQNGIIVKYSNMLSTRTYRLSDIIVRSFNFIFPPNSNRRWFFLIVIKQILKVFRKKDILKTTKKKDNK